MTAITTDQIRDWVREPANIKQLVDILNQPQVDDEGRSVIRLAVLFELAADVNTASDTLHEMLCTGLCESDGTALEWLNKNVLDITSIE